MASAPVITLHYSKARPESWLNARIRRLNHSRSQRILWLLEELELPYELKTYSRGSDMLAPPELKAVHPLGKSPVITIQEEGHELVVLAESGAIVELLVERYGKGKLNVPADGDLKERADYLYFLHAAEGTFMLPRLLTVIFSMISKTAPFLIRPIANGIGAGVTEKFIKPRESANASLVEAQLKTRSFIVGEQLTGADIMMSFIADGMVAAKTLDQYPATAAWYKRCTERPAWKRAEEKGGKTDLSTFVKQ